MLRHRLVFGSIMILAVLTLFYLDDRLDRLDLSGTFVQSLLGGRNQLPSGVLFLALILAIVVAATQELAKLFRVKGVRVDVLMMTLASTSGCSLFYVFANGPTDGSAMAAVASVVAVLFLAALIRYARDRRTEGAMAATGATLFSLVYLGLLPGFYLAIRHEHSPWVIAALILITKSCDIGAYFVGRMIGKHKLIPWLSPGKTWEGFLGGVATSGLVSIVIVIAAGRASPSTGLTGQPPEQDYLVPLGFAAAVGLVLGAIGQLGDLVESLLKRDADIKDSASTIPGFGGILDVCDSPILVAPFAYWLLICAQTM